MDRRHFFGLQAAGVVSAALSRGSADAAEGGTVAEPARQLDVIDSADIVILGGGPAGCAAAVAAGRLGADVLLVERYGYLGGLSTGGLVILIGEYDRRLTGLPKEFTERFLAAGECRFNPYPGRRVPDEPIGNPETYIPIYYQMAADAGVRFLFHAWAVGAVAEGGNVGAVVIESKSGRQAIRAKMVIDCTGDGDTAEWLGVPHEKTQHGWALGLDEFLDQVDFDRFQHFADYNPEEWKRLLGESQKQGFGWAPWQTWRNDIAWINTSSGGNALDVKTLTATEIDLRNRLQQHLAFFRENVPGFENATVMKTATQTGVRITRTIVGEHVITKADLERGRFEDAIGKNMAFTDKPMVELPYRALVPTKTDNLLYAGRCISCTAEAQELIRGISACWIYGQAAGTAAALCLKGGIVPRRLDVARLQDSLRSQGVEI